MNSARILIPGDLYLSKFAITISTYYLMVQFTITYCVDHILSLSATGPVLYQILAQQKILYVKTFFHLCYHIQFTGWKNEA